MAILALSGVTGLWNACSEVGFGTMPGGINNKVGDSGFEVIPESPPGNPGLPDLPGEGGIDSENPGETAIAACGLNISDILVNVERFFPQGEKDGGFEAQAEAGSILVSLKNLTLKALSDGSTNTIRMVVKESGHLLKDDQGKLHPLGTFNSSQTNDSSGIKIRLAQSYEFSKSQTYHLNIINLQSLLRSHSKKGCVLDNNSSHEGSLDPK